MKISRNLGSDTRKEEETQPPARRRDKSESVGQNKMESIHTQLVKPMGMSLIQNAKNRAEATNRRNKRKVRDDMSKG